MNFIVICAHTPDNYYTDLAERLKKSLIDFNIPYHFYTYESQGTWLKSLMARTKVIRQALDDFPNQNIVSIDADAVVRQYPLLFETIKEDVGVHYYNEVSVHGGTLFFQNNDNSRRLLDRWIKECEESTTTALDQDVLSRILSHESVSIFKLPDEYVQIFGDTNKAVIQHYQASRKIMDKVTGVSIPKGVRRAVNGIYYIPSRNKVIEEIMDSHFERQKNELKWIPRILGIESIEKLKGVFAGQTCTIVGKGPSLDRVTRLDFVEGPVICINESIHKVETLMLPNPIFGIQQDTRLRDTCLPKQATQLLEGSCQYWYPAYPKQYIYFVSNMEFRRGRLTGISALEIAKLMGASKIRMLCFDAIVNGNTDYATCIGHRPSGNTKRFIEFKTRYTKYTKGLNVEWVKVIA